MKRLLLLMSLTTPTQFFRVIVYMTVRRVMRIQYAYSVELYKVIVFLKSVGGKIRKKKNEISIEFYCNERPLSVEIRRNSSDAAVFHQVFALGEYKSLIDIISCFPKETIRTIVDAGANVGFTSIFFSRWFPGATIMAIEPAAENVVALKKNFSSNQICSGQVFQRALWVSDELLEFGGPFRDGREWSIHVRVAEEPGESGKGVRGISLMEILRQQGLDGIDLLKIDIEGAEKVVFSDELSSIAILKKVKFLAIELHEEKDFKAKFETILRKSGFCFVYMNESLFGFNKELLR